MANRILFIDDEKNVLSAFQRLLRGDFEVTVAEGGEAGIAAAEAGPGFAVVVCDMRMPGKDGIETLSRIADLCPDTTRVMLTGNADQETAIRAINEGHIFRFLTKPCPDTLLRETLRAAVRQHELVTAERTLLEKTLFGAVRALMDVVSITHPEAFGRAARMRAWVKPLAKALGLRNTWEIEVAAALSPIGLVAVPPDIIAKAEQGRPLSPVEAEVLAGAPDAAYRMLAHIPRLQNVAEAIRQQDKRFAGHGHTGPAGADLPVGARVLHILKDLAAQGDRDRPDVNMVAALRRREGIYDPEMLDAADRIWGGEAQARTEGWVRKDVPLSGLLAGDRLIGDIVFENGKLLLGAGIQISLAQIERLRALRRLDRLREPIVVERQVQSLNPVAAA